MNEKHAGLHSLSPYRVNWASDRMSGPPVHVGIVHAGSTICHVCAAPSADGLTRRLGEYVRANARYQLCSGDAARVTELLEQGRARRAIELYFGTSVQRWDAERLVVRRIVPEDEPGSTLRASGWGETGGTGDVNRTRYIG